MESSQSKTRKTGMHPFGFLFGNLSIPCHAHLCHLCLSETPDVSTVQDFSAPLSAGAVNIQTYLS